MMASTDTREGASVTMEALDLGAIDFIEKPANIVYLKGDVFKQKLYSVYLWHIYIQYDAVVLIFL